MEKKYKIKVTESITSRTENFSTNVIESDYIGHGNSAGDCVIDAKNQAEKDWETHFLSSWKTSRKAAGKDPNFSTTCLEFNILKRY